MAFTSSSQQALLTVKTGKGFHFKPRMMDIMENNLKLIVEQVADFKSFEVNGYPIKEQFDVHGWMHFFNILNGSTYPYLVKYLWVRDELYDEVFASLEERVKIVVDQAIEGSQEQKWV